MAIKALACVFIALSLSACVSMSPDGTKVAATNNPNRVKDCRFISDVEASSGWGGFAATGLAHDNALKTLKNKAGEMGGDTILFSNVSNTMGSTRMMGEAYKCN